MTSSARAGELIIKPGISHLSTMGPQQCQGGQSCDLSGSFCTQHSDRTGKKIDQTADTSSFYTSNGYIKVCLPRTAVLNVTSGKDFQTFYNFDRGNTENYKRLRKISSITYFCRTTRYLPFIAWKSTCI